MPTSGTFLSHDDLDQLGQDFGRIRYAIVIEGRVVTEEMKHQLWLYQEFFDGTPELPPGHPSLWPKPLPREV